MSASELHSFLIAHGSSLNHIHVACAFSKAVQLSHLHGASPFEPGHLSAAQQHLVQILHGSMHSCTAREVSTILWAAAKLSFQGPPGWIGALLDRAACVLHQAQPQAMSMILYACACLQHTPPSAFMQRFHAASEPLLPFFHSQAMSNTLWAHARLRITPSPPWLTTFYLTSQHLVHTFSPQGLSNTLHSLATLSLQPPPLWLLTFLQHALRLAPSLPPQELSNTIWSLANLPSPPAQPPDLLPALLRRALAVTPATCPQHAANILHSCARLSLSVPPHLAATLLSAHPPATFLPCELSSLLWALAKLSIQPDCHWLHTAYVSTGPHLQSFQPRELACLLWSLSALPAPLPPPAPWARSFIAAATSLLPTLPARELSTILLSLPRLHIHPPPTFLIKSVRCLANHLPTLPPRTLPVSLLALSRLGHAPPTSFLTTHHTATLPSIAADAYLPCELSSLLTACARLDTPPPPDTWILAVLSSLQRQLPLVTDLEAASVLWALGVLWPGCCEDPARRAAAAAAAAGPGQLPRVRVGVRGMQGLQGAGEGGGPAGGGAAGDRNNSRRSSSSSSGVDGTDGAPSRATAVIRFAATALQPLPHSRVADRPAVLCCLLHGCAALGCHPPAAWLCGLLDATTADRSPAAAAAAVTADAGAAAGASDGLPARPDSQHCRRPWQQQQQQQASCSPRGGADTSQQPAPAAVERGPLPDLAAIVADLEAALGEGPPLPRTPPAPTAQLQAAHPDARHANIVPIASLKANASRCSEGCLKEEKMDGLCQPPQQHQQHQQHQHDQQHQEQHQPQQWDKRKEQDAAQAQQQHLPSVPPQEQSSHDIPLHPQPHLLQPQPHPMFQAKPPLSPLSTYTPRQLTTLIWALSRLRYRPTSSFILAYLQATHPHLPHTTTPCDVLTPIHSLLRLQYLPPPHWVAPAAARLLHLLPSMSTRDVAATAWALGRCRCVLSAGALQRLEEAVEVRSAGACRVLGAMASGGLRQLLLLQQEARGCCDEPGPWQGR